MFLSKAVEASQYYFFEKKIDKTQMSKPPELAATFLKNFRSIFVGHLGLQIVTYRVDTPCSHYCLTTISRDLKKLTYLCLFCLQVNEVTKNFRLIRDCFSQYFSWMTRFQHVHQQNPDDPRLSDSLPKFRRAMFTVGLLVRHFDFSKQQLYEGLPVSQFKDHNIFEFQW